MEHEDARETERKERALRTLSRLPLPLLQWLSTDVVAQMQAAGWPRKGTPEFARVLAEVDKTKPKGARLRAEVRAAVRSLLAEPEPEPASDHYHVTRAGASEPGPAFRERADAERFTAAVLRVLPGARLTVETCDCDAGELVYGRARGAS